VSSNLIFVNLSLRNDASTKIIWENQGKWANWSLLSTISLIISQLKLGLKNK
jgi:hypothetical protein